ncbi:hypothetical protein ACFYX5_11475 [Streptomyces rubiginosohelvolus]|uniref:hypothetical protein n=1 Tax=Streptomyces rubiginosohelvolus TaxID=67362 RepID=UPI0036A5DEF1
MGKKSFRKVPDAISAKISALGSDSYQVGVRKLYPVAQIGAGALEHLGICLEPGSPKVPSSALPLASRGRYSRWNLTGKVVRRIDLPKVHRTWGVETPNFGDWGKGSHTINFTRLVYPTEIAYGQQIPVFMTAAQQDDDEISIAFRVGQVLHRSEPDDQALIFALSLLQENVGAVDVVESETSSAEWLDSVSVAWEFLPAGKRDTALIELARRVGISRDDPRRSAMEERMSTLLELSPTDLIYGTSGFQRYVGARFSPSLVVFENVEYGNALYVMFEDWEGLSRRSRLELLAGPTRGFDRIPHRRGWEGRLRHAVNSRRDESP